MAFLEREIISIISNSDKTGGGGNSYPTENRRGEYVRGGYVRGILCSRFRAAQFRAAHFSAGLVVATRFLEYSVNLCTRLFLKLSYSLLLTE